MTRRTFVVAGTGYRSGLIRSHCLSGMEVHLVREPENPHDSNAVAVKILVSGLFKKRWETVGYIGKHQAPGVAKRLDAGVQLPATVHYVDLERDWPQVIIEIKNFPTLKDVRSERKHQNK